MGAVISWYLIIAMLGWLAWPLAFRLLPGLPDRGYTISRALGLILVGYVFWLMTSLGLLQNTSGGILLAALLVMGLGLWATFSRFDGQEDGLLDWMAENLRFIGVAETLFLLAFIAWAVVRAYNPDLVGTEKPMELAFLNGIRRSPGFPPRDPWLSGYAISYYYFGYVIVAMLADLSGTASSEAFNLAIALLFALTLLGSYGLVYNLIAARSELLPGDKKGRGNLRWGVLSGTLLGPLFVGVMGNLEGFLELLRALHLPFVGPGFWEWLDIEELSEPLTQPLMPPSRWRFWWWWRASRVIRDRLPDQGYKIIGTSFGLQPIDEFPMFSFVLGDMHPHVLALPFILAALALAFNVVSQRQSFSRVQFALYAVLFGGLAFLNTWDLPIYLFILAGALSLRQILQRGALTSSGLVRPILSGLGVLVIGGLLYLPWYISFSSQAGGILPNAIFATRLHQFLIMFGPFLIVIVWFLARQAWELGRSTDWVGGIMLGVTLLLLLIALMLGLGMIAVRVNPDAQAFLVASVGLPTGDFSDQALLAQIPAAQRTVLQHRLAHPLTPLFLTGIISVTLACLLPRSPETMLGKKAVSAPTGFVLLLILVGAMLALGPEFVYLRDNFGQRLNTIFKFYYAAWILFGVAAAYATYAIMTRSGWIGRVAFGGVLGPIVLAALVYPALAIPSRAGYFIRTEGELPPTLDGIAYIGRQYPADYAAILWLQGNARPDSVILEAVGGAYSYYARISSTTGIPTVLGWANHEHQWRGDRFGELAGTREQDVREIYNTSSIVRAQELLAKYGVTYVYVGSLERDPSYASPAGLLKFERFLPVVYRDSNVVIYRADMPLIEVQP